MSCDALSDRCEDLVRRNVRLLAALEKMVNHDVTYIGGKATISFATFSEAMATFTNARNAVISAKAE